MLLSSTMITMDESKDYLTDITTLEDDMTDLTFHEDNMLSVNLQPDSVKDTSCTLKDTSISFTRVTSLSISSDEEFFQQTTSMYGDASMLTKNAKWCDSSSSSSSDNQCVPGCDSDCKLGSRTQYYSEFVTDHHHLSLHSDSEKSADDSDCYDIPFPRIVEGCEDISTRSCTKRPNVSNSSTNNFSISWSSSSNQKNLSNNACNKKQKNGSFPCASSTMICDISMASLSKNSDVKNNYGSNSMPRVCSTTVNNPSRQQRHNNDKILSKSDGHHSGCEDELHSIFTWSIHDDGSNKGSIEELYLQNVHGNRNVAKPPLPPKKPKKLKPSEVSSTYSESLSGIEPLDSYCDSICDDDSLFDDDIHNKFMKARCLPRTSTRIHLHSQASIKSDFHCVPDSDGNMIQSAQKCEKSYLTDKRAVIKKLKKFSKSMRNLEAHEGGSIQTLANL